MKRTLLALLLSLVIPTSYGAEFKEIVTFGDSLTDMGKPLSGTGKRGGKISPDMGDSAGWTLDA